MCLVLQCCSALFKQFEWAWQNPQRTRRLKNMTGPRSKRTKESKVSYCFRILTELLQVGPWNRLSLTIRWLIQDYEIKFDPCRQPPVHMPIAYGPLKTDASTSKTKKKKIEEDEICVSMYQSKRCSVCSRKIQVIVNFLEYVSKVIINLIVY